jgi:hypothetical protein
MKTSVSIPEPLLRRARAVAATRGTTVNRLLIEGLKHMTGPVEVDAAQPTKPDLVEGHELNTLGVPVLPKRLPCKISNEQVNRMREELGI